jgi:hypothetical protein
VFQPLKIDHDDLFLHAAESVAAFCQDCGEVSDHSLSLLMARSLFTVGEMNAAAQVLKSDRLHGSYTESWMSILSSEYPFPELYPLFASRALRPLKLTVSEALWVLDFNRIKRTNADDTELALFQTLRRLIETVSNLWKKENGCGTLGLKGLDSFVSSIGIRPFVDHVQAVLHRCARENRWEQAPSVLLIDL